MGRGTGAKGLGRRDQERTRRTGAAAAEAAVQRSRRLGSDGGGAEFGCACQARGGGDGRRGGAQSWARRLGTSTGLGDGGRQVVREREVWGAERTLLELGDSWAASTNPAPGRSRRFRGGLPLAEARGTAAPVRKEKGEGSEAADPKTVTGWIWGNSEKPAGWGRGGPSRDPRESKDEGEVGIPVNRGTQERTLEDRCCSCSLLHCCFGDPSPLFFRGLCISKVFKQKPLKPLSSWECPIPLSPSPEYIHPGFVKIFDASEVGGLQCSILWLVGLLHACTNIAASFPGKVATTLTQPASTLIHPPPPVSPPSLPLSPSPRPPLSSLPTPPYLFSPSSSLSPPLSSRVLCSCALAFCSKPSSLNS